MPSKPPSKVTSSAVPDRSLRCSCCTIGMDPQGFKIGAGLALVTVICQIEQGRSAAVADITRCINLKCGHVERVKLLPAAKELGITSENVRACTDRKHINLYSLDQLRNSRPAPAPRDYNETEDQW